MKVIIKDPVINIFWIKQYLVMWESHQHKMGFCILQPVHFQAEIDWKLLISYQLNFNLLDPFLQVSILQKWWTVIPRLI